MSLSIHGGFLLQRYCLWGKLGFRSLIPHGILQRSNSNLLSHRSHIISVDVTSGMSCPRLSKSIHILYVLTLMVNAPYILAMNSQVLRRRLDKALFLDIGLCQAILGLDLEAWFLNPMQQFVNKREIIEAFVGQELLAYANPHAKSQLCYWQRNAPGSTAEIDYLIQAGENIIPIEVKSGAGTTLKSMHLFLESHPQTPFGIRFSTQNYSKHDKVQSFPLYAVAAIASKHKKDGIFS